MSIRVEANAEPIPGYRLIERLGGGGFGEVWKAVAPGGLYKAIKFVFGDLSCANDNGQRAEQELKAMKRVQSVRHPYILSLERYDIIDGQLMIVMELADRNLWDRFKECRAQGLPGIPREELLSYMAETAEALDLMNEEYQLQHLDIKPQNLFLVHQHIKVADFGLVKDLEGSQASVTGGITPVYAAPETFDGRVTRFTDQYSLGILYQELLVGQRPFSGTNVRQLILQHLQAVPNVSPLPSADQPHVARALSKTPNERFPTCRAFVDALRGVATDSGSGFFLRPTVHTASAEPSAQPVLASASGLAGKSAHASALGSPSQLRGPYPDSGSGQGITHNLRAADLAQLKKTQETSFRAPPEIKGPGTLFPGLIIALGQLGLTVMQRLRETLHTHVAPLDQLSHLRFTLIDTDPEIMRSTTRSQLAANLASSEVILAELNRPSYYLKPRDGRPNLESWLNPRILYRIPRSQVTTGVRALGRLAFTDNYRFILRRLQMELVAAVEPQALLNAAQQTGLQVRTNRPRVYVVTSLAGGTGSGMFLDVAYTVRALLRQMGYENPDVVGVLLLPPVDRSRTRVLSLGNTYAALTELNWFGAAGTIFQAKYHDHEASIKDSGPPFGRTILLPLPDESDEAAVQKTIDLCGQMLYRDLTAPLGRAIDLARAGLPAPPWESRGQYFQTFGMFQLCWPRLAMLHAAGRRLCQRVVQHWLSKDSKPLREAVQAWVQEQWSLFDLGADNFIYRLQSILIKELGKPADSLFASLIDPLSPVSAQGTAEAKKQPDKETKKQAEKSLDPEAVLGVLAQLEELIGRPNEELPSESPPKLLQMIRASAEALGNEWGQKLAELPVRLIEEPAFRLAGAEEAIRQMVATIEQVLQHHEPLAQDLSRNAVEAYGRVRTYCEPARPGQRRPTMTPATVIELISSFAKWRYQSLVLHHVTASFVGLRGHLSDELREVNFCRTRLGELLRFVDATPDLEGPGPALAQASIGRHIFQSGCKDLSEAVQLYLEGITPEHVLELDGLMQETLKGSFTALVKICLNTTSSILKDVASAMLKTARDYVSGHLPATSVSSLFFEQLAEGTAEKEIAEYHREATPQISPGIRSQIGPSVAELCVLATPEDEASERFRNLVQENLPETEILAAVSTDDILLYRERINLVLADLEHLGPVGHDVYMQLNTAENFTPHSRCDIDFRLPKE